MLKISRTDTEYLPSPTNDTGTTVKIVDFIYLFNYLFFIYFIYYSIVIVLL